MSEYTLFKPRNDTNKTNSINIQFADGAKVNGYLLEPLGISVDAKYDTFFNMDGKMGLLGEILGFVGGIQIGKAGFWTRQYYKGGSYIKIEGKMRIVNWDTTDYALDAMETMIARCMPTETTSVGRAAKDIKNAAGKALGLTKEIPEGLKAEDANSPKDEFQKQKQQKDEEGLINKALEFGSGAIESLATGAPRPATIITNFMNLTDMLLTSVNCTPSKELTFGRKPLYVDIDFSFMQREIKQQNQIRNMIGRQKPTVRVIG